jgi:hypothetical protein
MRLNTVVRELLMKTLRHLRQRRPLKKSGPLLVTNVTGWKDISDPPDQDLDFVRRSGQR